MTSWEIGSDARELRLKADGAGRVTFTVRNASPEQAWAVFAIEPGDGAESSWFTVADPERLVLPGWSAAYKVKIKVPPHAGHRQCSLRGTVRTADSGAEPLRTDPVRFFGSGGGTSGRSAGSAGSGDRSDGRTVQPGPTPAWRGTTGTGDDRSGADDAGSGDGGTGGTGGTGGAVASPEPTGRLQGIRGKLKLLVPIGAAVLVLLVVLGWLLFRGTDVTVPDLAGKTEDQARAILSEAELALGTVQKRQDLDAESGDVVAQAPEAGSEIPPGARVDIHVATHLDSPTLVLPERDAELESPSFPHLEWDPVAGANGYRVTIDRAWCVPVLFGDPSCDTVTDRVDVSGTTSARPTLEEEPGMADLFSGDVRWQVSALDDFAQPGPPSEVFLFTLPRHGGD